MQREDNSLTLREEHQNESADIDRLIQRMGARDDEALLIEGADSSELLEGIEGRTYGFTTRITPVGW